MKIMAFLVLGGSGGKGSTSARRVKLHHCLEEPWNIAARCMMKSDIRLLESKGEKIRLVPPGLAVGSSTDHNLSRYGG